MNEDFDERLRKRLRALDAGVPAASPDMPLVLPGASPGRRARVRVTGKMPLGLVATIALAAVAIAALSVVRPASNGAPRESSSNGSGMGVGSVRAQPTSGSGNPLRVYLTITNRTGQDDKLVGASSPLATDAGLYAFPLCTAEPTGEGAGQCGGRLTIPWRLIPAGETVEVNGFVILSGFATPMTVGQTVMITLRFAIAPPVTVEVPVVAAP